jgi:hypothetical protein
MSVFARPGLAVGFGAFFLCAETCLHFENILSLDWPSVPFHDWAVALFLIYGGTQSRKDWASGRPYQAVGWALNASLLYMALTGHLEESGTQTAEEDPWISERAIVLSIGVMLAIALCGLWSTLQTTTFRSPPKL